LPGEEEDLSKMFELPGQKVEEETKSFDDQKNGNNRN